MARHRAAARATRAALGALGLEPSAREASEAASVATLVRPPAEGVQALVDEARAAALELAVPIRPAPGALAGRALRISHTGRRATLTTVWSALAALAGGLRSLGHEADLAAAVAAASDAWYAALGEPWHQNGEGV